MSEPIPGFAPALVAYNDDPTGGGRIKVTIPNLIEPETPYWVLPGGWPGAGGENNGSQYPPPAIGSHVFVIFEYGVWDAPDAHAIYLTGYYGLKSDGSGESASPSTITEASTAEKSRQRTVVYETDDLAVAVIDEDDDHRVVIEAFDNGGTSSASVGAKLEVRAKDGASGRAASITIQGRTSIEIFSQGLIDIDAGILQLQGRRVLKGSGRPI